MEQDCEEEANNFQKAQRTIFVKNNYFLHTGPQRSNGPLPPAKEGGAGNLFLRQNGIPVHGEENIFFGDTSTTFYATIRIPFKMENFHFTFSET